MRFPAIIHTVDSNTVDWSHSSWTDDIVRFYHVLENEMMPLSRELYLDHLNSISIPATDSIVRYLRAIVMSHTVNSGLFLSHIYHLDYISLPYLPNISRGVYNANSHPWPLRSITPTDDSEVWKVSLPQLVNAFRRLFKMISCQDDNICRIGNQVMRFQNPINTRFRDVITTCVCYVTCQFLSDCSGF